MPDKTDTITDIREQVAARIAEEEALLPPKEPEIPSSGITPDFVKACLDYNEVGDGILYTALHRDKFLCVKSWGKKPWAMWNGHHWKRDTMGRHRSAVDNVALEYVKAAAELAEPIKRERSLLDQANARVASANKRTKELLKRDDLEPETIAAAEAEGKEAEADARKHGAAFKGLQRQQKKFNDRAEKLRSWRGATSCIDWSHHHNQPLAIEGHEMDQQPWLLACPNGTIDLQSGTFRSGRPSDLLLRTVDVEWPIHLGETAINHYLVNGTLPDGSDPHPEWTAFTNEIQPEKDVRECMERIIGYAITGFGAREQFLAIYLGKGRNGKGTYFTTIQRILGELAWAIQPEFILEEKNPRSTSSASPDIIMIQGRRVIIASENDEKQRISAAKVKRYTGGNQINARGLFEGEEENFSPTWTMFLETNHVPEGLTKDFAMRQRMILIDFPWLYVDDPADSAQREPWLRKRFRKKDPELGNRLMKEDPYILLYLVRCCLLWQAAGGIHPPERLKAALEDLAVQEDVLQQFINVCCSTDWSPIRHYNEGEQCQIPNGDDYGRRFRATGRPGNKGHHPDDPDDPPFWEPCGCGVKPDHQTTFKEFYGRFKAFYQETQSESDKYRISTKECGKRLRERGYDVRNRGRGTVITAALELLPADE